MLKTKNFWTGLLVGAVVVGLAVWFIQPSTQLGSRTGQSLQYEGTLSGSSTLNVQGATQLRSGVTLSGATSTLSEVNLLSNSTSVYGIVLRRSSSTICYILGVNASVSSTLVTEVFVFTTSSCQ